MSYRPTYDKGDWKAICDVCGREYKASRLRKRWDGLMTCLDDWETRQPQDFVRGITDTQIPPWTRPESSDFFINVCTPETRAGGADFETADCAEAQDGPLPIPPPSPYPDAPIIGTATGGDTQATVTFTPPVPNGSPVILGYTVTSLPAGGVDSNAGTTGLSHLITGLTNGVSYTFTVTATNINGTSVPSAASNSVTPIHVFTGLLAPLSPATIAVTSPFDITISPDGKSAYVVHNDSSNVIHQFSRDVVTGLLTAIGTAACGDGTHNVAITPDGKFAYAGNENSLTISMYSRNLTTGILSPLSPATFASGTNIRQVAISGDGQFLYELAVGVPNVIAVRSIDSITGLLTSTGATINVGNNGFDMIVSPDDLYIYVTNYGDDTVSRVIRNVITGALTFNVSISTGTGPFGLNISPDGGSVYVANSGSANVSQYSRDVGTGVLTALSPATVSTGGGSEPLDITISPDSVDVYVADYLGNDIHQFSRDLVTGLLTALSPATIAAGTGCRGLDISQDGLFVYAVNAVAGTISMYSRT